MAREYEIRKSLEAGLWQAYRRRDLFGLPFRMPVQIGRAYRTHADAIAAVDADLVRRRGGPDEYGLATGGDE